MSVGVQDRQRGRERPPVATGALAAAAGFDLLLQLAVNALQPRIGYEFHRDELLYLAMGKRLELFGMESAPGIALLAALERALLGTSVFAIRLAPAVAGAALVVLTGLIAREMGGRRWAQGAAALAAVLPPVFLRTSTLFQPVVFDQLAWVGAALAVAWAVGREDPRGWLAAGATLGFGLLFKPSALFFGFGLALGLVLTRERRALATRWPWLGVLAALAGAIPWLVGQVQTGWPFFEQSETIRAAQTAVMDRGAFLSGQVLFHWPSTLLAIVGLAALVFGPRLRRWRILAVAWAGAFAVLLVLAGKAYYLTPAYPMLFAAGCVAVEGWSGRIERGRVLRAGVVVALVVLGLPLVPFGLPLLPPLAMAAYARAIGIEEAVTTETGRVERLPQDYADMLGWREQAAAVARVWRALPAREREEAVIVAGNYGEAGALDLYGPALGLPEPSSPVSAFHRWGLHGRAGTTAVVIGASPEEVGTIYRDVAVADTVRHRWAIHYETDIPIVVGRDPRRPLAEAWPELREP